MKRADVTPEQLDRARTFLRTIIDPPLAPGGLMSLAADDLIQLVAWYGGICVEDVLAARKQERQT